MEQALWKAENSRGHAAHLGLEAHDYTGLLSRQARQPRFQIVIFCLPLQFIVHAVSVLRGFATGIARWCHVELGTATVLVVSGCWLCYHLGSKELSLICPYWTISLYNEEAILPSRVNDSIITN